MMSQISDKMGVYYTENRNIMNSLAKDDGDNNGEVKKCGMS